MTVCNLSHAKTSNTRRLLLVSLGFSVISEGLNKTAFRLIPDKTCTTHAALPVVTDGIPIMIASEIPATESFLLWKAASNK